LHTIQATGLVQGGWVFGQLAVQSHQFAVDIDEGDSLDDTVSVELEADGGRVGVATFAVIVAITGSAEVVVHGCGGLFEPLFVSTFIIGWTIETHFYD